LAKQAAFEFLLLPPAKAYGRKNLPKTQQDNQLMRILPPSSVIVKL
jgi:hypothetical protein